MGDLVDKKKPKTKSKTVKDMEKATTISADRRKALEEVQAEVDKEFGSGSFMRMGDKPIVDVEVVPSGCLSLDKALGVWGFPRGRIAEVYGPESSGKTTLALHVVAEVQKAGGVAAFIDAEHALDPVYAGQLGVDVENLWLSQPDSGEQALELAERLVRRNAVDVIVVDSVAALTPQKEIDGDMGDSHVGLQARLMSQALRKLTSIVHKSDCIVIFINQIRMKIGVMFGSPETTTGGNALKFYCSLRLDIRKIETINGPGGEPMGNRVRIKVVKNKVAPPFRKAESTIVFGKGFDYHSDLLDLGVDCGAIVKSGSWYSRGDARIGQGKIAAAQWLKDNPDDAKVVYREIRSA